MKGDKETKHVLVAENLPIVRAGLVTMLEHMTPIHLHVVSVSTKTSLKSLLAVREFDFLFISPNFDGGFDIASFRQNNPDLPCIAIVSSLSQLGVTSTYYNYVTVFDSAEKIVQLIENYKPQENKSSEEESPDLLSSREKEILIHLAKGKSNKEVADTLCLSVYTIMTHRRNICQKLKIHSLSGLTIYAIAKGLIEM